MKILVVLTCLVSLIGFCSSEQRLSKAVDGVKTVVDSSSTVVKNVAKKTLEEVSPIAKNIRVKVDRFTTETDEPTGGVLSTTARGVATFARNVTSETGKYVGSIAGGAVNLGRKVGRAAKEAVKATASRIRHPLGKPKVEIVTEATISSVEANKPDELTNIETQTPTEAST